MLNSIVSSILAAAKSTKTLIASFVLTVVVVRYLGVGDVADRKSIEFGLNFLAIFFTLYLVLLFISWAFKETQKALFNKRKQKSRTESIFTKLELLTSDEKSLLASLVKKGQLAGTIDLLDTSTHRLIQIYKKGLIDIEFIDSVGDYRLEHRYRYEINAIVFDCVQELTSLAESQAK